MGNLSPVTSLMSSFSLPPLATALTPSRSASNKANQSRSYLDFPLLVRPPTIAIGHFRSPCLLLFLFRNHHLYFWLVCYLLMVRDFFILVFLSVIAVHSNSLAITRVVDVHSRLLAGLTVHHHPLLLILGRFLRFLLLLGVLTTRTGSHYQYISIPHHTQTAITTIFPITISSYWSWSQVYPVSCLPSAG